MICKQLGFPVVLLAIATGCMGVGTKFDISSADKLHPGVSTRQDAIDILGKPNAESKLRNETTLLQWQYAQGTPVGGSGAHLAILFDKNNIMIKVAHKFTTNPR